MAHAVAESSLVRVGGGLVNGGEHALGLQFGERAPLKGHGLSGSVYVAD